MKFLLPTGIGDSVWALHKIQAIRDKLDPGGTIDVSLVGTEAKLDSRALKFVKMFKFVNSANMKPYGILHDQKNFVAPDGTYDYIDDGWYRFDGERYCVLIPNKPLEHGVRLEDWLPDYGINWEIWNDFEMGTHYRGLGGEYCVFYLGPLHGNTFDGHNRNALWKPDDWIELTWRVHEEFGLKVIFVGADYDASYFEWLIKPSIKKMSWWVNMIGKTILEELWNITSHSRFVISYQAGVGIVSTYLGTPTGIFWRPYGDSISPNHFLTFNEKMASAWVPPHILEAGTHLPLIYGRHGVDFVMSEIRRRGWLDAKVNLSPRVAAPSPSGWSV